MKGFTIEVNSTGYLSLKPKNLTIDESIDLSLTALDIFMRTAYQTASGKLPTAEADFEIRSRIYDMVIIRFSDLINRFYPEHVDLYKKTPEELLNRLEDAIHQQSEAPVSDM